MKAEILSLFITIIIVVVSIWLIYFKPVYLLYLIPGVGIVAIAIGIHAIITLMIMEINHTIKKKKKGNG